MLIDWSKLYFRNDVLNKKVNDFVELIVFRPEWYDF